MSKHLVEILCIETPREDLPLSMQIFHRKLIIVSINYRDESQSFYLGRELDSLPPRHKLRVLVS